jgi:5-methylcytosine-specific restriction protein A
LQQVRARLFRAQPMCVRCHVEVATIRDHIIPLCDGGLDVETNTQALCATCHDAKTEAESKRHHVRR